MRKILLHSSITDKKPRVLRAVERIEEQNFVQKGNILVPFLWDREAILIGTHSFGLDSILEQ